MARATALKDSAPPRPQHERYRPEQTLRVQRVLGHRSYDPRPHFGGGLWLRHANKIEYLRGAKLMFYLGLFLTRWNEIQSSNS